MKFFKTLAVIAVAGLVMFIWRAPLRATYVQTYDVLFPCRATIYYRLGSINPEFDLSTSTALADMTTAASLWNDASGRPLLAYSPERGQVVISFEYDSRQETTRKLSTIGDSLDRGRATYDALKTQYSDMFADYQRAKAAFVLKNDELQKAAATYQTQVDSWNARGGAPPKVYSDLETQKNHLIEMQSYLKQSQSEINARADSINEVVSQLNSLAKELNLNVTAFNTISDASGGEFEQGVYESSIGKRTITIFEYENHVKLVRVLAHEMGHAIGLDHVADQYAIMAEVNEGPRITLTRGDADELDRVCALDPFAVLKAKLSDFFRAYGSVE